MRTCLRLMIKADSRQASRNFLTSETGSRRNRLLEFYILENEINLRVIYQILKKGDEVDGGLTTVWGMEIIYFHTGINFVLKQINECDVILKLLHFLS